jgi:hypothetical protein
LSKTPGPGKIPCSYFLIDEHFETIVIASTEDAIRTDIAKEPNIAWDYGKCN